ncbi:hypothetical protein GCM10010483_33730 [Actinokineospora diospyrosa]
MANVLDRRTTVLGEEHPDSVQALNNLAVCHTDLGETQRAADLFGRAVASGRVRMGPHHPDIAVVLAGLKLLTRGREVWRGGAPRDGTGYLTRANHRY